MAALLIAGIASVYLYNGQPVRLVRMQGVKQSVPDVSGAPKTELSVPLTLAAKTDAALTPAGLVSKPATETNKLDKVSTLAPSDAADVALPMRSLSSTAADVRIRQDPPIFRECPQAVATLGLCSPATKKE